MSGASIYFTDSIHPCVNGSYQLQHVNNSIQRERVCAETFIWKITCHGQLQQEVDPLKRGQALWLKRDKVQSYTLLQCFHLGLFSPCPPLRSTTSLKSCCQGLGCTMPVQEAGLGGNWLRSISYYHLQWTFHKVEGRPTLPSASPSSRSIRLFE